MRGHIHKRVRKNRKGKETTLWYVVVDAGASQDGRRRQKWHGGFATRREAEVARAKIVNDLHGGAYISPAGVPVTVVSERLGHESPAFTLKQYAHVVPGMQAEAAHQVAELVDAAGDGETAAVRGRS